MFRSTASFLKRSAVSIRPVVSEHQIGYSHQYFKTTKKYTVGTKYNEVNDRNRFKSLEIICDRLSGYVGRRQYKMKVNLKPLYGTLENEGIDWHDLKYIASGAVNHQHQLLLLSGDPNNTTTTSSPPSPPPPALSPKALGLHPLEILYHRLGLTPSQRLILNTALDQRLCGVLVSVPGTSRSNSCCMRPGKEEFGWRCGKDGHVDEIYFERKKPAQTGVILSRKVAIERFLAQGMDVEIRKEPDFAIEGRRGFNVSHLRKWENLTDPRFDIQTIGFDFRIHESDPRVEPQIVRVANEWEMHAQAIKLTIQELIEQSAVMRHTMMMGEEEGRESFQSADDLRTEEWQARAPGGDDTSFPLLQPLRPAAGEFISSASENPLSLQYHEELSERKKVGEAEIVKEVSEQEEEEEVEEVHEFVPDDEEDLLMKDQNEAGDDDESRSIHPSEITAANKREGDNNNTDGTRSTPTPVEYRMRRADGSVIPWFKPPIPHKTNPDGTPSHLPLAPSIAIKAELDYGEMMNSSGEEEEEDADNQQQPGGLDDTLYGGQEGSDPLGIGRDSLHRNQKKDSSTKEKRGVYSREERLLREPELRLSMHIHPDCCAIFPSQTEEDRFVEHILSIVKKMPYALPFNLFYRVDPVRAIHTGGSGTDGQGTPGGSQGPPDNNDDELSFSQFGRARNEALAHSKPFFNLKQRFGSGEEPFTTTGSQRGNRTTTTVGGMDDHDHYGDGAMPQETTEVEFEEEEDSSFEKRGDSDDMSAFDERKRREKQHSSTRNSDDPYEAEVDQLNPEGWH